MTAPETQEFVERGLVAMRRSLATSKADSEDPARYNLIDLVSHEVIQRKRKLLDAAHEAWMHSKETTNDRPAKLRRELEQKQIPAARIEEIMESMHKSDAQNTRRWADLPTAQPVELWYTLKREILDFAEANLGEWQIDSNGRVVFSDAKLRDKHMELGRKLRELVKDGEVQTAAINDQADAARERLKQKNAEQTELNPTSSEKPTQPARKD